MTDMKVVQFPVDLTKDPVGFLRAFADDIEAGHIQMPDQAVLFIETPVGFSIYGFGAKMAGERHLLALISMAQQLMIDTIIEG